MSLSRRARLARSMILGLTAAGGSTVSMQAIAGVAAGNDCAIAILQSRLLQSGFLEGLSAPTAWAGPAWSVWTIRDDLALDGPAVGASPALPRAARLVSLLDPGNHSLLLEAVRSCGGTLLFEHAGCSPSTEYGAELAGIAARGRVFRNEGWSRPAQAGDGRFWALVAYIDFAILPEITGFQAPGSSEEAVRQRQA